MKQNENKRTLSSFFLHPNQQQTTFSLCFLSAGFLFQCLLSMKKSGIYKPLGLKSPKFSFSIVRSEVSKSGPSSINFASSSVSKQSKMFYSNFDLARDKKVSNPDKKVFKSESGFK